jgi:ADP-ribose pyrophosphatase YjhB (NUDIX family)
MKDIKKEILVRLLKSEDGIRYRDGKSVGVENDLYNYHLKQLVKNRYVEKRDYKYYLTDLGKKYIEVESPLDPIGQSSDLFRINIIDIVYRKSKEGFEILNQRRKRHPYYGDTGVIGGSVRNGELIIEAAKRKLKDETGLDADFKLIGVIRKLRYDKHQRLFSDIPFHICITNSYLGDLVTENEFGENFWADVDSTIDNQKKSVYTTPSDIKVLTELKNNNFDYPSMFYYEDKIIIENFN